ncbi:GH25 family lysozyme [Streptomyces sp. NPDC049887]|uniref:GH25 family lysozyme n=1 Tax=Streptomyces sp. NPDC049887 TaxID=3155654 RepID=UPI003422E3BE
MPLINGVDVASYQSTTYDTTGLDFVFVKATEGTTYSNPKMSAQVTRARSARLVVGFYHFLRAGNPKGQAGYFVNRAGARPGEILACDWETAPDGSYPSNAEKDAFLREVKRLAPANRVVLYCNRDYWLNRDKTSYAADGLWIADPSAPTGAPRVRHPWVFHQHSITGGIDRNVGNFPTRDALRKWAGDSGPAGGGSELELSDTVPITQWAKDRWKEDKGLQDGSIAVATALGSGYVYARAAAERAGAVEAEIRHVRAQVEAQAAALAAAVRRLDALTDTLAQLDVSGALGALQDAINATTVTLRAGGGK